MMEWTVVDVLQNEIILSIDTDNPQQGGEVSYARADSPGAAEAERTLREAIASVGGAYGNLISDRFATPIDLDAALTLLESSYVLFSVERTKGEIGEYTLNIPEDALP